MTQAEARIREASEFAAREFIRKSPAEDWTENDQEWIRAIFMTAFVKGAIWEKETQSIHETIQ